METNDNKLFNALTTFKAEYPTITTDDIQTFIKGWNASINESQLKEIDKQIKKFSIELANLKENLSRDHKVLSDAEIDDYANQIKLTSRIIGGLNRIKQLR